MRCSRVGGAGRPAHGVREVVTSLVERRDHVAPTEQKRERQLGAGPALSNQLAAARAEQAAQHQGEDDRVVELPRDRDEVGHEIEGKRQVGGRRRQEQLAPARTRGSRRSRPTEQRSRGESRLEHAPLYASPHDQEEHQPTPASTSTASATSVQSHQLTP